jgi:hypothetical protein
MKTTKATKATKASSTETLSLHDQQQQVIRGIDSVTKAQFRRIAIELCGATLHDLFIKDEYGHYIEVTKELVSGQLSSSSYAPSYFARLKLAAATVPTAGVAVEELSGAAQRRRMNQLFKSQQPGLEEAVNVINEAVNVINLTVADGEEFPTLSVQKVRSGELPDSKQLRKLARQVSVHLHPDKVNQRDVEAVKLAENIQVRFNLAVEALKTPITENEEVALQRDFMQKMILAAAVCAIALRGGRHVRDRRIAARLHAIRSGPAPKDTAVAALPLPYTDDALRHVNLRAHTVLKRASAAGTTGGAKMAELRNELLTVCDRRWDCKLRLPHLLRPDGSLRSSPGEIARAIAVHLPHGRFVGTLRTIGRGRRVTLTEKDLPTWATREQTRANTAKRAADLELPDGARAHYCVFLGGYFTPEALRQIMDTLHVAHRKEQSAAGLCAELKRARPNLRRGVIRVMLSDMYEVGSLCLASTLGMLPVFISGNTKATKAYDDVAATVYAVGETNFLWAVASSFVKAVTYHLTRKQAKQLAATKANRAAAAGKR